VFLASCGNEEICIGFDGNYLLSVVYFHYMGFTMQLKCIDSVPVVDLT
jgi:hypothetical protein